MKREKVKRGKISKVALILTFVFSLSIVHAQENFKSSFSNPVKPVARGAQKQKYWNTLEFRFNGFYCTETQEANAWNLLAIQNRDNIELTDKPFSGYGFGVGIFVRPFKNFDFFFDINHYRTKSFIAHEGDRLVGNIAFEWMDQGFGNDIPKAPHDLYYGAKTYFAKLGGRFIFPVNRFIEPWVGLGYGLLTYEVAIGNKDLSRAYTDVITGTATAFTLTAGIDFNLFASSPDAKKLMGLSIFADLGRQVPTTDFDNFLWQGLKYHITQTPVLPYFRFGLALHMPWSRK